MRGRHPQASLSGEVIHGDYPACVAFALSLEGASVSLALPEGPWVRAEGDGVVDGSQIRLPAHGWAPPAPG